MGQVCLLRTSKVGQDCSGAGLSSQDNEGGAGLQRGRSGFLGHRRWGRTAVGKVWLFRTSKVGQVCIS